LVNAKATTVSPAEGQQKEKGGQETTTHDYGSDASSGDIGSDSKDFAKLAANALKPNAVAPAQSPAANADQTQAMASGPSIVAPHQDRATTLPDPTQQEAQPTPTNAGPNWRSPDDAASKGVSSAQLAEVASHTEMRIAMQTDKLGNVELRAHVSGESVGAAITVEKRDAHSLLAVELPALQQALAEKSLRVDQVALFQGSLNLNDSQSGRDERQQHATGTQQGDKLWASQGSGFLKLGLESAQGGAFDSSGRLNVHA
jgi:hypothetical protein